MTFHIITIFPELFKPYLSESILGKAVKKKLIKARVYDLRKFATNKHNKVDDTPYGGGPGMVMSIEPLARALEKVLKGKPRDKTKVLITAAAGKQFDNKKASVLASKYKHIVLVAGRYEGVDERVLKVVKKGLGVGVEEVSVGPYVLTGGELPAISIIDSISRQVKGVLGKKESLEESRYGPGVPVYTKPDNFRFRDKNYKVPPVLLSGDHKEVDDWRRKNRKEGQ